MKRAVFRIASGDDRAPTGARPGRALAPSPNFGVACLLLVILALAGCGAGDDPYAAFRSGDYDRAFKSFLRRADNGDSAAINFVGVHYYLGLGVPRDFAQAAVWFERAARAANADAQRNLGVLYLRGWGVRRDNVTAYAWLFQAVSQGNGRAREYLEMVEHQITPNQTMQARTWIADQLRLPGEPRARQRP